MTQTPTRSEDIVVGIDGSSGSDHALEWAITEATRVDRGITLVHGLTPATATERAWLSRAGVVAADIEREKHHDAEALLREKKKMVVEQGPQTRVATLVCDQDPRMALAELSKRAHQVVVGSRGHGRVASLLLGSVSEALTHSASCPVVVVRPRTGPETERGVVVGLSAAEGSAPALAAGFAEAAARGVPLIVALCMWDGFYVMGSWGAPTEDTPGFDEVKTAVASVVDGFRERYPDVPASILVAQGSVTHCFLDVSRTRDLLVVGRPRGRAGWGLTGAGSIATTLVAHAHVPVMVVP